MQKYQFLNEETFRIYLDQVVGVEFQTLCEIFR